MAKISKNIRLGLSFGAEELFLAQTEESANRYKVTALTDITSSVPFSIDLFSEPSGAEMVGEELKKVLAEMNITSGETALSIDLDFGTIVKLPYDKKLSQKDLKTHLKWELQQYIEEDIENYIFDSYKLIQSPSMKQPELVLVGTRTKVVDFFKQVCEVSGLDLAVINLDIIAALNCFEANYKYKPDDKIALVEVGDNKLVFSLLEGNFFIGYHYVFLDEPVQENNIETVHEYISMNLKTLFTDYELGKDKSNFDKIFLYRTNTKISMEKFLGNSGGDQYTVFNPFEKVRLETNLREQVDISVDNSEYVEALGLTIYKS